MMSSTTTTHHLLQMEWADYPKSIGEVTACFCSCGWKPEGWTLTISTEQEVEKLAKEWAEHVR